MRGKCETVRRYQTPNLLPARGLNPAQRATMTESFIKPEWRLTSWRELPRKTVHTGSGRGPVTLIAHPRGAVLERQYRRGGVRRILFATRFFKTRRAKREFALHQKVYQRGIATIEPVGWRSEPAGVLPFLRHYYYYTRYLEGALPLPQWLRAGKPCRNLAEQMAETLYRLFREQIFHVDLNLNNWIVHEGRAYLIDFDKALLRSRGARAYLDTCIRRMLRSAKKLGLTHKKRLFFRFLARVCRYFGLNCREVLASIPGKAYRETFYDPLRWKLSGGHRQKTQRDH